MSRAAGTVTASAPGSIMITGEHAVVYGHPAIVAAIDQRVVVTLQPRTDHRLRVTSQIAPPLECDLDALPTDGAYRFVLAAVACQADTLSNGINLDITSAIDPTLGLGSSAAVTIITLGALAALRGDPARNQVHQTALRIIRDLQGRGSGADLAASLWGGCQSYRAPTSPDEFAEVSPLPLPIPPLSLRYCGYKTPTAEVLALIAQRRVGREAEIDALYDQMGQSAARAIAAARADDPAFFGALQEYQELMVDLGVSDATLDRLVGEALEAPGTLAVKISGSGLGDCVLAFGRPPPGFEKVAIAQEGLVIHG